MATIEQLEQRVLVLEQKMTESILDDDPYQSSHTGPEIDEAVGRAKSGGVIDTALAGKAPSGYGIGEENAARENDTDLDTLKKGGTYYLGTGCTNTPPNTDSSWSTLHVIPGRACTQIFIPANDANRAGTFSSWIARIYNDKTAAWGEWEWVNPPMALGVEYRTTERYRGKPVYAKCVNFGTLPNSGRKQAAYTESSGYHVISITGNAESSTNSFPIPSSTVCVVKAYANSSTVFLETEDDLSAFTAYVIVKYTKD